MLLRLVVPIVLLIVAVVCLDWQYPKKGHHVKSGYEARDTERNSEGYNSKRGH